MYRLATTLDRFTEYTVMLVGCGGTGGFLAESLCRILPEKASLLLVDPDRVEEHNLGRQNFGTYDLGGLKAEVLAVNLARKTGRSISYIPLPIGMVKVGSTGIVLGCVDNGPARADIAELINRPVYSGGFHYEWWIDAGNGENYGQILIGNGRDMRYAFHRKGANLCNALPLPSVQQPGILVQAPRKRNCAEAVAAGDQGPTINQVMAALMLEVTRRLLEGTCPWMQLYVDMEAGSVVPVLASPEAVDGMTDVRMQERVMDKEVQNGRDFR